MAAAQVLDAAFKEAGMHKLSSMHLLCCQTVSQILN